MAPIPSSLAAKLKAWVTMDEGLTTDGRIVVCQVCEKKIGCSMKSQLEQHIRSALHKRNKQHNSSRKQVLLTQMQHEPSTSKNIFFRDMCTAMVAANIPWYKVQVIFQCCFIY